MTMYQQIRSVVEDDFKAVDKFIVDQLYSNVPLVENIGHYIAAGDPQLMNIGITPQASSWAISFTREHSRYW